MLSLRNKNALHSLQAKRLPASLSLRNKKRALRLNTLLSRHKRPKRHASKPTQKHASPSNKPMTKPAPPPSLPALVSLHASRANVRNKNIGNRKPGPARQPKLATRKSKRESKRLPSARYSGSARLPPSLGPHLGESKRPSLPSNSPPTTWPLWRIQSRRHRTFSSSKSTRLLKNSPTMRKFRTFPRGAGP